MTTQTDTTFRSNSFESDNKAPIARSNCLCLFRVGGYYGSNGIPKVPKGRVDTVGRMASYGIKCEQSPGWIQMRMADWIHKVERGGTSAY